jgi:hypothetical protein
MDDVRARLAQAPTGAWTLQVWLSFLFSTVLTLGGIYFLPVDLWARGYLLMGVMFTIGSTFSLAKTVRDGQEATQLRNRLHAAKAEKLLQEYERVAEG